MSTRKLAPGESPRQAVLVEFTAIVDRLRKHLPLDFHEFVAVATALSTAFAWTDKVQEHKMPLLAKEIEDEADALMVEWGFGPVDETETPPDEGGALC